MPVVMPVVMLGLVVVDTLAAVVDTLVVDTLVVVVVDTLVVVVVVVVDTSAPVANYLKDSFANASKV